PSTSHSTASHEKKEVHMPRPLVRFDLDDFTRLPRGRRIRVLRAIHGWTQEQLAKRIGVSKGSVSDWERGNWAPEDPHLWRLAMVFGVPVGVLAAPDPPEELVPGDLGDDVTVPEERAEWTTSQESER